MTIKTWTRSAQQLRLPLLLVAAGLGALAGCGRDEPLSRQEFRGSLQRIKQREGARFNHLAQRALRLKPNQALPGDVKQAMQDAAEGNRRAAEELDELEPPEDAEQDTHTLIEALRQRADGFERAARRKRITLGELEEERSITRAGETIDRAFERLRKQGFLPEEDDHPEE